MEIKHYSIDRASWHIDAMRNYPEEKERIIKYFNIIIDFLDDNKLLISKEDTIDKSNDNDLVIHTSNLTSKGRLLMKLCYNKWLSGFDRGKDSSDLKIFMKGLKKIDDSNEVTS